MADLFSLVMAGASLVRAWIFDPTLLLNLLIMETRWSVPRTSLG